jgi:proteasome accessory factor C
VRAIVGRLRRALFILPYLTRRPEGVPLAEIAAMFGLSPRQMATEIARLNDLGVPGGDPGAFFEVFVRGKGDKARVHATRTDLLPGPPRLTRDEANALLLGAATLRRTGLPVFDQALTRASRKIRRLLAETPRVPRPAGVAIDAGGAVPEQVFAPLARASRDRRVVQLDYTSLSSQRRKKIEVEPYGLLNHGGAWYVLGKSLTHRQDRVFVFRLARIRTVAVLDRTFVLPADFDLRKYRGDRMFLGGLEAVEIKLRLRGQAARRPDARYKRAQQDRDGSVLVRFRDVPNGWLGAWVLRQGRDVEVLSPPSLAGWVAEVARRVVAAHLEAGVSAEERPDLRGPSFRHG